MLRDAFTKIAAEYESAKKTSFAGHPLAAFIRDDSTQEVEANLSSVDPNGVLIVDGSPGKGRWAEVPWVGIFDPVVTDTATRGYYVVYLFSADMRRLYLSLNQGTTAIHEEFGAGYVDELSRRAQLMRQRLPEYTNFFTSTSIDLDSRKRLPKGYEAGHAFGIRYETDNLPSEDKLQSDLQEIVRLYLSLTARGGIEPSEEVASVKEEAPNYQTVIEVRRYRLHRRIERDSTAARQAKKFHGHRCQVCGFDFEEVYGELGKDYIEAHHLTPLASLPEDVPAAQDPKTDFAVLCSNCHRMIHRTDAPGDLEGLQGRGRVSSLQGLLRELGRSSSAPD